MCCPSFAEKRKTEFTSNQRYIIPDSCVATHYQTVVLWSTKIRCRVNTRAFALYFSMMSNKRDPSLLLHAFIVSFVSVMVYVKRVKRDEELRARIELEDSFLSEN